MNKENLRNSLKNYLKERGLYSLPKIIEENGKIVLIISKETSIGLIQHLYELGFSCKNINKEDLVLFIDIEEFKKIIKVIAS